MVQLSLEGVHHIFEFYTNTSSFFLKVLQVDFLGFCSIMGLV